MHIKFQLIRLFNLFIWWCETTEGFIENHFGVKDSTVYSVAMGLIITTPWSSASTVHLLISRKFNEYLDPYPSPHFLVNDPYYQSESFSEIHYLHVKTC